MASCKHQVCYCCLVTSVVCNPLWPLWTVAHQAPLSMGYSRQEYWSGLPCPTPGDLPDLGIKPGSPVLQADSLLLSHLGRCKHQVYCSPFLIAPPLFLHLLLSPISNYFNLPLELRECFRGWRHFLTKKQGPEKVFVPKGALQDPAWFQGLGCVCEPIVEG